MRFRNRNSRFMNRNARFRNRELPSRNREPRFANRKSRLQDHRVAQRLATPQPRNPATTYRFHTSVIFVPMSLGAFTT